MVRTEMVGRYKALIMAAGAYHGAVPRDVSWMCAYSAGASLGAAIVGAVSGGCGEGEIQFVIDRERERANRGLH